MPDLWTIVISTIPSKCYPKPLLSTPVFPQSYILFSCYLRFDRILPIEACLDCPGVIPSSLRLNLWLYISSPEGALRMPWKGSTQWSILTTLGLRGRFLVRGGQQLNGTPVTYLDNRWYLYWMKCVVDRIPEFHRKLNYMRSKISPDSKFLWFMKSKIRYFQRKD